MRFSKGGSHELLHDGVDIIGIHLHSTLFHEGDKTNSKESRVHPIFICLGRNSNWNNRSIALTPQSRCNLRAGLTRGPSLELRRLLLNGGLIQSARREERRNDLFLRAWLGVVLEEKIERGDDSERPDGVADETGVDDGEVGDADNVGHHVLVECVEGLAEDVGEFGKSFADGSDGFALGCSEAFGEGGLRCSWLVFRLCVIGWDWFSLVWLHFQRILPFVGLINCSVFGLVGVSNW